MSVTGQTHTRFSLTVARAQIMWWPSEKFKVCGTHVSQKYHTMKWQVNLLELIWDLGACGPKVNCSRYAPILKAHVSYCFGNFGNNGSHA